MGCFHFSNGRKKKSRKHTMAGSVQSGSNTSMGSGTKSWSTSGFSGLESLPRSPTELHSRRPQNLRIFSFGELKAATNNFSRAQVVGEGGFGYVYRGTVKSCENASKDVEVAIKQLSCSGMQGPKEWLTEINILGIVEHQNLVKLIGYCAEDDERGMQWLLVYEFMSNRSVLDHLSSHSITPLPWQIRLRVALDAARGLTYLHEEMNFQIIFRDFKTSNILLDEQWNAKLSDFGLARKGPDEGLSHVSTTVVGTNGYTAPEYMNTGRLTAKSDVWSYGVVLYELITGRRPIDHNRPKAEKNLLDWVRPFISNHRRFPSILDPRLAGEYHLRSALQLAAVANLCLVRNPKSRPKTSEALAIVAGVVAAAGTGSPPRTLAVEPTGNGSKEQKFRDF